MGNDMQQRSLAGREPVTMQFMIGQKRIYFIGVAFDIVSHTHSWA